MVVTVDKLARFPFFLVKNDWTSFRDTFRTYNVRSSKAS